MWTTQPWSLPSNVGIAVSADDNYVVLRLQTKQSAFTPHRIDKLFGIKNVNMDESKDENRDDEEMPKDRLYIVSEAAVPSFLEKLGGGGGEKDDGGGAGKKDGGGRGGGGETEEEGGGRGVAAASSERIGEADKLKVEVIGSITGEQLAGFR